MSPADDKAPPEGGVLGNLPSTRPQRPSARRAAARTGAGRPARAEKTPTRAEKTSGEPAAASGGGSERGTTPRQRRPRPSADSRRRNPRPIPPPPRIPAQGYEAEGEVEPGVPVAPPTGPELAGAVVELVGDLAQAGLAGGGRLLRDALDRLRGV